MAKPWLDRTILFVLSRAAFGQATTPRDLWRAQRQVWWRQLLFTLTVRRLSPWRSLTQPVYQLEGLSHSQAAARVRQIRRGAAPARRCMVTLGVRAGRDGADRWRLLSLVFWFAPAGYAAGSSASCLPASRSAALRAVVAVAYALAVLFLEPFYVAAGFAMYLNRRAELEAWDIEQEFRRAFAQ